MRPAPWLALVLLAAAPPAALATQGPEGAVPEDLTERVTNATAALDALAQAPASQDALERALASHAALLPFVQDLAPASYDLLDAYGASLAEAEDEDDRRDLARAMRQEVARAVAPAVEEWTRLRTTVVAGAPERVERGVRVPVLLLNPPPGGIGAFDVRVAFPDARILEATVALGRGEAVVEPEAASARLASFDAGAVAGVSGGSGATLVLGHVVVALEGASVARVEILDLAARDGSSVLAVSPDLTVSSADAVAPAPAWKRWALLGAVGGLAVAGIVAARRFLKV